MSKPEVGQLTFDDRIAIGKAASFLRFQAAYSADATEPARQEWRSTAEALTDIERRCQPQPAEDPDEWVIQDVTIVRPGIDQVIWDETLHDADCGFFVHTHSGSKSDGKMHGYRTGGIFLSVRCRRRDLPKVEQVEQALSTGELKAVCDDVMRWQGRLLNKPDLQQDGMFLYADDGTKYTEQGAQPQKTSGTDWSYHEKQKPQPRKKMLRLWIDSGCNIHAGLKNDGDLELYYDHETRQFYTEEPS